MGKPAQHPQPGPRSGGTCLSSRRIFLGAILGSTVLVSCGGDPPPDPAAVLQARVANSYEGPAIALVEFSDAGERLGVVMQEKIVKSREQWKLLLTPLQFQVTRDQGTEFAFTGKYNKHYQPGIYRCVGCGTALFHSETKFDSGTGWPSFWAPIAEENVATASDAGLGIIRTEVICARCDAHLGHVFPDGPPPTYQRYCINSAALTFAARP